ncbi:hypothetical protein H9Q74_014295 [Fusarium xylarioides]|nr:hypothetical protein H9Q71_014264 [Fusarium xylarioides]KAG5809235.1 hypothetical protein H9Q74_014295 [Fusarium xylarioides]
MDHQTGQEELPKIRIAVLDSGVDVNDLMIDIGIKQRRINCKKSKSFVHPNKKGPDNWRRDTCGHGTHVTQLLLKTAPAAEIFVGEICTDKVINDQYMPGISEAIYWATNECDAHIISISFGYEDHDDLIEDALDHAISKGKLIIAAASNNGGLKGRSRPASREGVICIHATDGKGNKGKMSPSPLDRSDNFATLGVAVPLRWQNKSVFKSAPPSQRLLQLGSQQLSSGLRSTDVTLIPEKQGFCVGNEAWKLFFVRWLG